MKLRTLIWLIAILSFILLPVMAAFAGPRPRVVMRHERRMAAIHSGVALQRATARTYFWQTAANVTGILRPSIFTIVR